MHYKWRDRFVLDIDTAFKTNVSAVGVSSYFLYQKKNFGVLVNIPNEVKRFQEQGFLETFTQQR